MAEKQDNISPEEKLLNVIQADNAKKPEAVPEVVPEAVQESKPVEKVAPVPVTPAKSTVAPVQQKQAPVAEKKPAKSALKMAKEPVKSETSGKKPGKAPVEGGMPGAGLIGAGGPIVAHSKSTVRKRKDSGSTLRIVNRTLAALLVALLCFAGLEIFGAIRSCNADVEQSVTGAAVESANTSGIRVSIQEALGFFVDDKDPFAWGGESGQQTTTSITTTTPVIAWMDHVKTTWRLMGVSLGATPEDAEAIVMDTTDNRMMFLKKGDAIAIQNVQVQLDSIEGDRIRLSDGKTGLDVLPSKKTEQKP